MQVTSPAEVFRIPKRHEGSITVGKPDQSYRAFEALYPTYIVMPMLVGIGKIFGLFANWQNYLAPRLTLGLWTPTLIQGIGIAEVLLGVFVALNPRAGAVAAVGWLWLGAINIILMPGHAGLMIAFLSMSVGAIALSWLAEEFAKKP